jgi:MFS-type transporter involved in bile tolerance (Atg22 family)
MSPAVQVNPWRDLGLLPRDVWILFAATLVNRAGTMAVPFLVVYLTRNLEFSAGTAGLVLTVYGVGAIVAAPIAGRLSDRTGPVTIMKASLFVSGVLLLFVPLARSFPETLAITLAWRIVRINGRFHTRPHYHTSPGTADGTGRNPDVTLSVHGRMRAADIKALCRSAGTRNCADEEPVKKKR